MKRLLIVVFFLLIFTEYSFARFGDLPVRKASKIKVDTTAFNNILSASNTTVQSALETLDDELGASYVSVETTNFNNIFTSGTTTLQKALDATDDINAASIPTSTTNFSNMLSASDTTVQIALDTLDEPWAEKILVRTADFGANLSAADTTAQKALDTIDDMATGEWTDTGTIIHPSEPTVDEVAIGGTTEAGADIFLGVDGFSVFNEQGNDADFRVEGQSDTHLLFLDASLGRIGISESTPSELLDINNLFKVDASGNVTTTGTLAAGSTAIAGANWTYIDDPVHIGATTSPDCALQVGDDSATADQASSNTDDVFIEGILEVDGLIYADGGISGLVGGASGDVQYNDGASGFAGEAAFNYDAATNQLTLTYGSALPTLSACAGACPAWIQTPMLATEGRFEATGGIYTRGDIYVYDANNFLGFSAGLIQMLYDLNSGNDNLFRLQLPESTGSDIPIFVIADSSYNPNNDSTFDNLTDPGIVIIGDSGSTDYLLMQTKATEFYIESSDDISLNAIGGDIDITGEALRNANHIELDEITTPTAVADHGKVYTKSDNNLYFQDGAGTEHTLLKGASSVQHAFFTPLEDPTGTVGNWDIIEINSAQAVHFTCQIPEDFEVLDAATVVMIPDTTETIQWDIYVSVAAAGEAYNNDDRSALNQTLAVTANQITEADVSGQLTGISAGDYIAIDYQSDTANLRIVGFEFDWN